MAITFVEHHLAGENKDGGTAVVTFSLNTAVSAGNTLIIGVVSDNIGLAGPTVSALEKPVGETASFVDLTTGGLSPVSGDGDGVRAYLIGITTTVEWPSSGYDVTLSSAVAAKGVVVSEFTGLDLANIESGPGGSATDGIVDGIIGGASSVTGDLVVVLGGWEDDSFGSIDTDTTRGTWNSGTGVTNSGGGNQASKVAALMQHKILTGTGSQDYSSTGQGDCTMVSVVIHPAASGVNVAADPGAVVAAGQTPALAGSGTASRVADVAASTIVGQTPTLAGTGAAAVTADTATLALAGQTGTLASPVTATGGPATLPMAGVDPAFAGSGAAPIPADTAALVHASPDPTLAGSGVAVIGTDAAMAAVVGVEPVFAGSGTVVIPVDTAQMAVVGAQTPISGTGTAAVGAHTVAALIVGLTPGLAGVGVASVPADTATATMTGQTPIVSAGGVVVVVDTATLDVVVVDATFAGSGVATIGGDTGAVVLVGETPTFGGGPLAIAADTATLDLVAPSPGFAPTGAAAVGVDPAALGLPATTPTLVGTGTAAEAVAVAFLVIVGAIPALAPLFDSLPTKQRLAATIPGRALIASTPGRGLSATAARHDVSATTTGRGIAGSAPVYHLEEGSP